MKDIPALADVSRETKERLEHFVALLEKWNRSINLISSSTVKSIWSRHIEDSVQIVGLVGDPGPLWLDLGSGGGLPGIVVSILLAEKYPETKVTMIESDARKCVFLRTVVRETGLTSSVLTARIEEQEPMQASVISARALSSLTDLLGFQMRHGTDRTFGLYPKGRKWEEELRDAQKIWTFDHAVHPSRTDPEAVMLKIEGVAHV